MEYNNNQNHTTWEENKMKITMYKTAMFIAGLFDRGKVNKSDSKRLERILNNYQFGLIKQTQNGVQYSITEQ